MYEVPEHGWNEEAVDCATPVNSTPTPPYQTVTSPTNGAPAQRMPHVEPVGMLNARRSVSPQQPHSLPDPATSIYYRKSAQPAPKVTTFGASPPQPTNTRNANSIYSHNHSTLRPHDVELQQPITIKHTNPSNNLPPIDSNKNMARSRKPLSVGEHVTGDINNDVIHQTTLVTSGLTRGHSAESSVSESSFIRNANNSSLPAQRHHTAARAPKKAVQFADDVTMQRRTFNNEQPQATLVASNGSHMTYSMV